ncbi:MAG: His-Xaa-Ser system radical SAM maturase HxsB [Candidatus Altiarchaeota archaeon]
MESERIKLSLTGVDYIANKYSAKRYGGNRFLIVTDHGAWAALSQQNYDLLRTGRVSENPILFNVLESRGIILTAENMGVIANSYFRNYSHLYSGTSLHIVSPSLRCNHACSYCFACAKPVGERGYDMDEDVAKATVDFIFQTPAESVTIEISGGEPLMNFPIVEYIVDYSKRLNRTSRKKIRYVLVTNLTLMDYDILKFVTDNEIIISTSLDGPREVHDRNRKYLSGAGSYSDVVYWLDTIRKDNMYGQVGALPVVTKHSLPYWREIVDEYLSHGLPTIRLKYLTMVGVASNVWHKIGYSPADYLSFWKDSLDYILGLNRDGVEFNEGLTQVFLKKIIEGRNPNYCDLEMPCGAGISQLAYSHDGSIHTCDEGRSFDIFRLGSVLNDTYGGILSSQTVLDLVDISSGLSLLCSDCIWMPYCGVCPVWAFSESQTPTPRIPVDFRCKVHSAILDTLFKKLLCSEEDNRILRNWVASARPF